MSPPNGKRLMLCGTNPTSLSYRPSKPTSHCAHRPSHPFTHLSSSGEKHPDHTPRKTSDPTESGQPIRRAACPRTRLLNGPCIILKLHFPPPKPANPNWIASRPGKPTSRCSPQPRCTRLPRTLPLVCLAKMMKTERGSRYKEYFFVCLSVLEN